MTDRAPSAWLDVNAIPWQALNDVLVAVAPTPTGRALPETYAEELRGELLKLVRAVAAGAGDPPRDQFCIADHHWMSGANSCPECGRGECMTSLQAGDRPPAPSEAEMMPRVMGLVGGVLMLCNELERTAPGLPTIDGKRLRVMAEEVRDAWPAVRPPPRAALTVERLRELLLESNSWEDGIKTPYKFSGREAGLLAEWLLPRLGAASPAAAPPEEP